MTSPRIKCEIHKYTNTKCLKDPTCAIFLKSMGFKDIKYHIPMYQMGNTQLQSAQKTTHVLYFLKVWDSRISNPIYQK